MNAVLICLLTIKYREGLTNRISYWLFGCDIWSARHEPTITNQRHTLSVFPAPFSVSDSAVVVLVFLIQRTTEGTIHGNNNNSGIISVVGSFIKTFFISYYRVFASGGFLGRLVPGSVGRLISSERQNGWIGQIKHRFDHPAPFGG